jgi:hypothetical protein
MSLYAQIERTSGGAVGTQTFGQMSIVIYDSATGLPANGNGIIVTYDQNINGTVTNNIQSSVLGTTYPVYTGELSDTNPSSYFFTNFTVVSAVMPSGGGTPTPSTDDLVLVAIDSTPESAIGAGDGTVEIIATSSYGPIQYSLDNATWQTSPIFTGQPGGAGTGYAKDANGGLVSGPYTVGFVGNVLAQDPGVNLGNGNISQWNAAFNPIWFRFQRKDFEVTSVISGPGTSIVVAVNADLTPVTPRTTVTVSGQLGNFTTTEAAGDFVYIKTAQYEGTFEVLAKTAGTLTLDCTYAANDTTGFININSIKPYYQVQTVLTYVDPITGKFTTSQMNFSPNSTGYIEADLSTLLQTLLVAKDLSNYTLVNYRDMQLSASYTLKYAEVWTGGLISWTTVTRPYYVVFSAKQLGTKYGGNLAEYVPYPLGFQPAKWVTDFKMPVYNGGFPFDLGFIFSEYMVGLAPFYNVTLLDINMNPLTDQSVANGFLLNEDGSYSLNQDASKFIIASSALVSQPIVEHVGLNRLLINFDIPELCYYFIVQIKYTAGGTTYNLTQPITCRIDQNTPDRPVYLRWIGLSGSWEYYRFVYNQLITLDVAEPVTIKRFVVDWQNEDTIVDVISKNAGEKVTVWAENVSVDDIKGLQSIKYSPKVQILTSDAGVMPPTWQTVSVASGTFNEQETYLNAYSFSITIALPEINVQTQ